MERTIPDYDFEPYLSGRDAGWCEDDELLRRLVTWYAGSGRGEDPVGELSRWGGRVSGPLRELAGRSARAAREEGLPSLRRHDAWNRRVDEILLPGSTERALREVEGREGLGAVSGDPFVFYARAYLYWQNGEAGVACSMACTDGLVRALEALGDGPEHEEAVARVRGSDAERVWHGAQFVTEIQGGSDVPANRVRAVPAGDAFRLHGQKWFCSNVNADYFLVTARPDGAPEGGEGIGLFLVPAYRDPEAREDRNGYTIDRLKEKLGTRELATAEVTFEGARARPVGPLDRGLPNLIEHVLVPSRFACVISAAAFLRRAQRIVEAYTDFREAFGHRLAEFPLVRRTLRDLRAARRRALASVFELLELWEAARAEEGGAGGSPGGTSAGSAGLDFRILLSLCKPVLTRRATEGLHEAMMLLGGNGIEEAFSPLPRLHRDAVIMETWEGPHNVLLTQALRDLARFGVDPASFVERVAGEARPRLAGRLEELVGEADDPAATVPFSDLAGELVDAFADRVLEEAGAA